MSRELAQRERRVFADLLRELGPDAPTLCEGWTAADLAAHIVARERRPDSGPGLVWPPLAGHTYRVRRSIRDNTSWDELVARVQDGPPPLLRPFDGPMNTVEFFIHVEDLRRAQPSWEPRELGRELDDALWARLGAGGMARKAGATVELASPGRASKEAGSGPRLVVRGDPGELMLFATGRQGSARVEVTGEEEPAARLRNARLGI